MVFKLALLLLDHFKRNYNMNVSNGFIFINSDLIDYFQFCKTHVFNSGFVVYPTMLTI